MSPPATSPARAALLAAVADGLPTRSPVSSDGPVLVAVDGPDGVGKSCFADELAAVLRERGREVVRASLDEFHHPRAHRHAQGRTADTVFERSYDYDAVRGRLLDPWREGPGHPYRTALHDVVTDEALDPPVATVPTGAVLLVDGVFAQRAELADCWDHVIYLDVPFTVSAARMAARDGTDPDLRHPDQRRYVGAQLLYAATARPRESADVVVDNTDLDAPRFLTRRTPAPTPLRGAPHG